MSKKPANPTNVPAARVQQPNELVKFFQCLGTAEVPANAEDVHRVVHSILTTWKDKPHIMRTVPFRENGIRFAINLLARRQDPTALKIVEETIDALGSEAPNSLRVLEDFGRAMRILDSALPEENFEQYREEKVDDDATAASANA